MDEEVKVRDIDIRGKLIPVYLDEGGDFRTHYPLEARAETWEGLRQKLLNLTKKAVTRLDIAITSERHGRNGMALRDGVVRGRHGGNGNILIQWEGEKTAEQNFQYGPGDNFLRLSPEEKAEWKRLYDASEAAQEAFREWREPRQIRLGEVVDKALNTAAAGTEAAPIA